MPNTPKRILDCQMNLIGTHDTMRILTALGGEAPEGHTNDELAVMHLDTEERREAVCLLKIAYTILATLPGVPMIYYGDEAGMEGYSDPFNRRPFPWSNVDQDLLSFYRQIGKIRHSRDEYREGAFRLLRLDKESLAFSRTSDHRIVLTIVNHSDTSRIWILPAGEWKNLLTEETVGGNFSTAPHTAVILGNI